jgi:hypothetical protein
MIVEADKEIVHQLLDEWAQLEPERCRRVERADVMGKYFHYVGCSQPDKKTLYPWDFCFQYRNESYEFSLLMWCVMDAIVTRGWTWEKNSTNIYLVQNGKAQDSNPTIGILKAYLNALKAERIA